jgi:hypothetical protein
MVEEVPTSKGEKMTARLAPDEQNFKKKTNINIK